MNFRLLLVITLCLGLLPASGWAKRYRQPAYVTNAYFTNRLVQQGDYLRPEHIINVIRASYPGTKGHFVIELIVDQGAHIFSIELLDKQGKKFDSHNFPEAMADKHDFNISVNLAYGGELPEGGIFFKVYDRHNGQERAELGTFRISSEVWQ